MTMTSKPSCMVVSVEMGYGHLRAAHSLADALKSDVHLADEAPLADAAERRLWQLVRRGHGLLSRPTPWSLFERPANALMDFVTMIPSLYDAPDQSAPDLSVLALNRLVHFGLGRGLVRTLREARVPLVTTFYAPAIIADEAQLSPIYCVVTDADVHRVWVPMNPERSNIHYLAPSPRVVRRLRAYGVREERISLTGFPLPVELSDVEENASSIAAHVARRIVRLDPEGAFCELHRPMLERVLGKLPDEQRGSPIEIAFAVGGAGAQVGLSDEFLPRLRDQVLRERIRVHLIAGTRAEVAQRFMRQLRRARLSSRLGSGVSILYAPDFGSYYRQFNQLLQQIDVLWTKPSELSFYAGLGLPLVLSQPVGTPERYNRRWLREQGAGLKQRRVDQLPGWFDEWLFDGNLAAAAWSAYTRIPRTGAAQIVRLIQGDASAPSIETNVVVKLERSRR